MKIVDVFAPLALTLFISNSTFSQTVNDSLSIADSTLDTLSQRTLYDWDDPQINHFDDTRRFRTTLKNDNMLRGVSDLLWQSSEFFVHSRGTYGSAWYGSLQGLNPRYLSVYMQGRPMRNLRKGRYDLSLTHDYNLDETKYTAATDGFGNGEPSVGTVELGLQPEFLENNTSQFTMRRGRGDYDDLNVIINRRLTKNSAMLFQGLLRDQNERESINDVRYDGRKIIGVYERRTDNGWRGTYTLNHTFRNVKLRGPIASLSYGYEANGRLREVAYDNTFNLSSPNGNSEVSLYLSTLEAKRLDDNRQFLDTLEPFEEKSLSYYYGFYLNHKILPLGEGGIYGGVRSEIHNIRAGGFEVRDLGKTFVFMTQKIGGNGFLTLEATEGLNSDSNFDSEAIFAGKAKLRFSDNIKIVSEYSKSVIDVPVDFQLMNSVNFSFNDSLSREKIFKSSIELVRTGNRVSFRGGYQQTKVEDPLSVEIIDPENIGVVLKDDYNIPAITGALDLDLSSSIKFGMSGWQNLDFNVEQPFARTYKGLVYGSWNVKFFDGHLDITAHGEEIFLGEGTRVTYDPVLDFYIFTRGTLIPRVSLFNYWFTAKISDLTIFLRNDNLFLTKYELLDGYALTGNESFWGVKWDFIN